MSLFLAAAAGCSPDKTGSDANANPLAGSETLVQISTIDAVLNGLYDGVTSLETLKEYGDFGIGTLAGLDGEMIGFDGDFYQVRSDGIAYLVADNMETPFAAVTCFDSDLEIELPQITSYEQLEQFLDAALPTDNIFYAVRIEGTFSYIKTRSVPRQEKPYPPLVEVTAQQPVFEFNDVAGTIAGFRSPAYVSGVNVPGYHLHFLTEDRSAGGHLLELATQEAVAKIDYTFEFLMILPGGDSDFYHLDLTQNKQAELEQAEK
ncbi:MAG: acetolactate decarboxylase [Dehalococcoidales bacterium]|nr:acetolactate decarboxylase [Dehalococcoidales bacterium]